MKVNTEIDWEELEHKTHELKPTAFKIWFFQRYYPEEVDPMILRKIMNIPYSSYYMGLKELDQ
jgi:hypothetical protein